MIGQFSCPKEGPWLSQVFGVLGSDRNTFRQAGKK